MLSPPEEQQPTSSRPSVLPWFLLVLFLVPLLACGALGVVAMGGVTKAVSVVQDILDGGELVVRDPNPAVVIQIKELGRLETASFTVEKVIEGGVEQSSEILDFFLGDRLLLIAHGDVIAGVDLTELREADVDVSPERTAVVLRLPPARIFSYRLDNELSYVYDRQTGLLTKGDPNLETEVRRAAEQRILQAACESGILEQAAAYAQNQVRALLAVLEFDDIEFLPARPTATTGCE